MWLSSNRREASAKNRDPTTSSDPAPAEDWQSALPLDWTRMRRTNQGVTSENDAVCCADPASCRHRFSTRPLLSIAESDEDDSAKPNEVRGQAIFCLHDQDPSWIQGYFIARGSTKPWGMLAVQEQVDDCLACSEGGYRRLSLTVYHHRMNPGRRRRENEKPWKIEGIDWTGGDMMSLYHPEFVNMESERLLTGEKALPMLHKYFQSLINRLEKEFCAEECSSVLEWLPGVAIITGPMTLTLPPE